jgi:hypothetical protein
MHRESGELRERRLQRAVGPTPFGSSARHGVLSKRPSGMVFAQTFDDTDQLEGGRAACRG